MSRLVSLLEYAALVGAVALATGVGYVTVADHPKPDPSPRMWLSSAFEPACPGVQNAIGFYRRKYTASRERMGLPGAVPRVWYPCDAARRRALDWRARARMAALKATRYLRDQMEWWRWMPRGSKWYRVASCETGYGRDPNWAHDSGTYVSAFGIYRPGYADDAHRVGNMSWDETIRSRGTVPTPREQYEAAVSHYNAHGGFSGWGCRGA